MAIWVPLVTAISLSSSNLLPESSEAYPKPARKLNLLLQHSPLAMIEWNSDFVVVGWNPAAAELFNFFEDEAIGQRLDQLLAQRHIAALDLEDWLSCERTGILREHVSIAGKKICRWYNTPFMVKGVRVGTLSTIVDITHQTALSNEELRSQLQSRTQVLKHTTARLQAALSERVQTHAALHKSETRFRDLAANVPGVLYQFCMKADGSYSIPYISEACQEIYELSADTIQTDPEQLLATIDKDDRIGLELAMRRSAETLTPWHSEHRIKTPSGQLKWVQVASSPQPIGRGDILWAGVLIDITERKQAETQLQSAHTFLHRLINGITDPIFVKDHNHQLTLVNDAFCEFVGRSRSEMIGKSDLHFVSQTDADRIWQKDHHVLTQGGCHNNEEYFRDAQGRLKFISITKTRFQLLDETPYILGVIRDLTEQAIAQKALQENEKRLKKLTANVPGMLYQLLLSAELEPSFPFISSNSRDLLEVEPTDLKANASLLIDRLHPEDKAEFNRSIATSAQTLCDWHWQGRALLPSGRTVWMQGAARPERLADNSVLWDGLLMDITGSKEAEAALQQSEARLRAQTQQLKSTLAKLKQTQAKLIQSEKMSSLGQLVAGIAHEINNPVNFIHGNLIHAQDYIQDMMQVIQLYQEHYPTPASPLQSLIEETELDYAIKDLPQLLNSIQNGAERIQQIVLSLRNFSRLDESELKQVNITEGLESTLMILSSRLKATASRHGIEVVKAYENIPMVECYVSQLNQVFMNILVNAIDAIDDAAIPEKIYQIVLQTFQQKNHIVIRITNNGPPIPTQITQQMFDPFFTTKPVGKGTGMGLAISYQTIVDMHGGTLEYSQTPDQKTVFTIEIPIQSPSTSAP